MEVTAQMGLSLQQVTYSNVLLVSKVSDHNLILILVPLLPQCHLLHLLHLHLHLYHQCTQAKRVYSRVLC